ncbi:MAG: cation diffusion facilitator family transporter [Actinomycetota bacterium]|nr:cation diffusion facilitator family transporter [Actinomycetota bacterium]
MENRHEIEENKLVLAKKTLKFSIFISLVFVAIEAAVGIATRSLSLVSDAGHNAADITAMVLSLFAVRMMSRKPTDRMTYGYGRVGILAALVNALALLALGFFFIFEAVRRLKQTPQINGLPVMATAGAALIVNLVVSAILHKGGEDLAVKSAFLHMAGDAALSAGVVVAGALIHFANWRLADPIAAIVLSLFIIASALWLIKRATGVLLESVPNKIDLGAVKDAILTVEGVEAVHDLHVWELGSGVYALSGHIELEDRYLSECSSIVEEIRKILKDRFKIIHPTIQLECYGKPQENARCEKLSTP